MHSKATSADALATTTLFEQFNMLLLRCAVKNQKKLNQGLLLNLPSALFG